MGAPFFEPRGDFVLAPVWNRIPISRQSRRRRADARFRQADERFRARLRIEVAQRGFDAQRAEQTVLEQTLDPLNRTPWIHDGIIGYGNSGNIALTKAASPEAPEVVEIVSRFKELAATARTWDEFIERQNREVEVRLLG